MNEPSPSEYISFMTKENSLKIVTLRELLARIVQRLESHAEIGCHLDARDRKAIADAKRELNHE